MPNEIAACSLLEDDQKHAAHGRRRGSPDDRSGDLGVRAALGAPVRGAGGGEARRAPRRTRRAGVRVGPAQGATAGERARQRRLRRPFAARRLRAERERQAVPAPVLPRRAARCRRRARHRGGSVPVLLAQGTQDQAARSGHHALRGGAVRGGGRGSGRHARGAQPRGVPERVPLPHGAPGGARAVRRLLRGAARGSRARRGLAGRRRDQARRPLPRVPGARGSGGQSRAPSWRSAAAPASSAEMRSSATWRAAPCSCSTT